MARASMFFFKIPLNQGKLTKTIKNLSQDFFSFLQTLIHKYVNTLNLNTSIHILNTLLLHFFWYSQQEFV